MAKAAEDAVAAGGGARRTGAVPAAQRPGPGSLLIQREGLLQENRHWTHAVIHETLVDLLEILKSEWGKLFTSYGPGRTVADDWSAAPAEKRP